MRNEKRLFIGDRRSKSDRRKFKYNDYSYEQRTLDDRRIIKRRK